MKKAYEAPELVEIGTAGKLTLGDPTQYYVDNCGCKSRTPPSMAF